MIHVRTDAWVDESTGEHSMGRIACGLAELPPGDTFYFEADSGAWLTADCPTCNPGGPKRLGTPISQLSGRPGHPGFEAFRGIAESWGHE
jgi:hypothetical protein